MPLTTLRPLVTQRYSELSTLLSAVANQESTNPLIPDQEATRSFRGLLYVHLYAAFEYSMDQSFIRFAQHINTLAIKHRHLEISLLGVCRDDDFRALQNLSDFKKKHRRRVLLSNSLKEADIVFIKDDILSLGMQSATSDIIAVAFEAYGISKPHIYDEGARQYINEVVSQRHAVAHGRESPVQIGRIKIADLRTRYDALYRQSMYVIDVLNETCATKLFIQPRYRRFY